ncbi:MAG: RAMP superfamily CRISPR-associated protein [Gracilibacteraceae bacterium]|nr:RAMP superfamily CRISPR-associated protein [Gracilibacteraceae bacterium]
MRNDNLNPVIRRIAVKANCILRTPALIGSGFGENTDSDVLRDASGAPFLPGSTVAGVLRFLCSEAETLFGEADSVSPLWVFDSEFLGASVVEFNGVELDYDNKVTREKKKYDFEAIDTGAGFTLRLLLTIREDDKSKDYETLLKKLLGALKFGGLAFGAKTRRGFGRVECVSVDQRAFELTEGNKKGLQNWLDFLEYDEESRIDGWKRPDGWEKASTDEFSSKYSTLAATLTIDGSIMIRDTRNVYRGLREGEKAADCAHISSAGEPVVLGTSWAGAFRSGLYRLLKQKFPAKAETYLNSVFGYVKEASYDRKTVAAVSQIIFGASFLEAVDENIDGYRNITRVKIDRFTGGAANGALFSEKPWYGGKTTVEIRFPKGRDDIKELLLLGLDGIDKGLMQVGGETAVGRGFFQLADDAAVDGIKTTVSGPKLKLADAIQKAGESV